MRNIMLLFTMVCVSKVSFAQIYTDKQKQLEDNKTKQIIARNKIKQATVYITRFIYGLNVKPDSVFEKSCRYDRRGNVLFSVERKNYLNKENDLIHVFSYDDLGNTTREVYYFQTDSAKGSLENKYEYNSQHRKTKSTAYYRGVLHASTIYVYDIKGNLITQEDFNKNGKSDFTTRYRYNDDNEKVEETLMGHLLKKEEEKINEVRYDHKISHTKTGDVHFFYSYNDIADGDIEFEYDYDQNGNQLRYFQVYKDGKLLLIENKFNKNNQLIESTNYNYSQYRKSVTIKTAKLITADREVKTYDRPETCLQTPPIKTNILPA
jgi:hypothetical protein